MSNESRSNAAPTHDAHDPEPESKGPNLVLYFSLIALALAAAIGCAIMIVLPFYKTRH